MPLFVCAFLCASVVSARRGIRQQWSRTFSQTLPIQASSKRSLGNIGSKVPHRHIKGHPTVNAHLETLNQTKHATWWPDGERSGSASPATRELVGVSGTAASRVCSLCCLDCGSPRRLWSRPPGRSRFYRSAHTEVDIVAGGKCILEEKGAIFLPIWAPWSEAISLHYTDLCSLKCIFVSFIGSVSFVRVSSFVDDTVTALSGAISSAGESSQSQVLIQLSWMSHVE